MSTFPDELAKRAAATIARTARLVSTAHQRLNTLGSQVSSLTPGDWELLTLGAGWSNMAGYIPAQVRIQQNGLALLVGHISGGTTSNGTVIATLASGYYNPVHAHSFTANVLSGAASVSVTGAISGETDTNALSDGGITGPTTANALSDGGITGPTTANALSDGSTGGTSAAASGPGSHSHGAGTYAVTNSNHTHSAGDMYVNNSNHTHSASDMYVNNSNHTHTNTSGNQASATPVNYNTVTLTVSTSGTLTLTNCSSSATEISFSEQLPLVTS